MQSGDPNHRLINFHFLLKLWEGQTLWYTFPVENKAQAQFLAGPWRNFNNKPHHHEVQHHATISRVELPIPRGWLVRVDFVGPRRWAMYALSVYQARLWNEWFGGVSAIFPSSRNLQRTSWKVTFEDIRVTDDVPF